MKKMADIVIKERQAQQTLRDIYYVLFRHKRKVTWFFFGVLIAVTLVTFLMPAVYRSEAKLLVRMGRESVTLDPTATSSGQVLNTISARRESEVKSELEILKSRDLAEKLVDALGPETFVSGSFRSVFGGEDQQKKRDAAVRSLMKNWNFIAEKDSNIINATFDANNPQLAQAVLTKLIDFYLEKHLAVNRTAGSHEFFKQQTEELRANLAQTEKALEETKNKTGLASIPEQRRLVLERISTLKTDLERTEVDLRASQDRVKAMRETLAKLPETVVTGATTGFPNFAADGMRQKLYELQLKEQELLSKYMEKNFLVQEVRRQIANAQALLNQETPTRAQVTKGINTNHQQVKLALVNEESNLAALQAKSESLGRHLASTQEELKNLNENEIQVARLQRDLEIQEANYRKYADKLEQARIDSALETGKISNISIAQAATYPLKPVRPRKGLNLALGLMLGTFGAIGLAFMAEYTDHSFKRPEDVEKQLQMPVLATIPRLEENGVRTVPSVRSSLPILMPENPVTCEVMGEAGEGYEALCDCLLKAENPPRLIGVTSCRSGEGVSSVAANLATTLARKGNARVLLVEANLMRPSAHHIFGIAHSPGLTDVLLDGSGDLTAITNAHTRNLDVITSGQGGLSFSQLADSREFADLLHLWRNEYSFVVFDLPPIFKGKSAHKLANLVEGLILVVGAEGVSWEVAQRAKGELSQTKVNVLGVVLNKRCYHIPQWLYRTL
jgi:capsular exopolysaccharide synthesis family protein